MSTRRQTVKLSSDLDLPKVLNAPVSPVIRGNGFLFTMGFMALDPDSGDVSPGTVEHETRLTLEGLRRILEQSGSCIENVVKAHVFLADIDRDFDGMNSVYREFFSPPYPARRTVQATLARGLKVEIDVIALE